MGIEFNEGDIEAGYKPYKYPREIFQGAADTLTDGFYEALELKLLSLGIAKETVKPIKYIAGYTQDDKIVRNIISLGLDESDARALMEECKLVAKHTLSEEIVDKGFPIEVVDSVIRYVSVVQKIGMSDAANDDADCDLYHPWVREQLFQLGAAGENCPPEYLAAILDAVCFMMVHHPKPTQDTFHIYKRFPQAGHIDIHAVVDELARQGAMPNQVRAILNLHKHYGACLGSAFLALVKNSPKLLKYRGGVLQLAADLADLGLEPAIQEGIIGQVDKEVEYCGGALQLAVDLAARRISDSLQVAIVKDAYYLQDYPGGLLVFAEDVHRGGFSAEAHAGLVTSIINMGGAKRDTLPRYIANLAKLRAVNPTCIEERFMSSYRNPAPYYTMIVEEDAKLAALTADNTVTRFPHLTQRQLNHLFDKLLSLFSCPSYVDHRPVAFVLAERAAQWSGYQFENAIDQLCNLSHGFSKFRSEQPPKGSLPTSSLLAQDLVAIAESDQANVKGRWYHEALYRGAEREDVMTVLCVPFASDWTNQGHTFRPSFEAIADRFLGDDPAEKARLAPIVGIILREASHYYLGIGFGVEPQPMGVICRYVFGLGPEEEGGVTIADIKQCESMLGSKEQMPQDFAGCLATVDKVSKEFRAFGDRIRGTLRETLVGQFRNLGGQVIAAETPIEWLYDYLQRYPDRRLANEAEILSSPSVGRKLSFTEINEFVAIATRLSQQYPTQVARFEEFILLLLWRSPGQRYALSGAVEPKTLPGRFASSTDLVQNHRLTLAEVMSLTKALEAPKVLATPENLTDIAPPKLTRLSALAVSNRITGAAGRMLRILGECAPGADGTSLALDDDLSSVWWGVMKTRISRPGFPPVGAKLHVDKAVSTAKVDDIITQLGLKSTTFRTIHSGKSLLAPIGQPIEIKLLFSYLKAKGLFDDRNFDMQVCIGGRLKPRRHEASIGVLNASMLLATKATPSYAVDAWSTPDHNSLTNAYIMAYGDRVRDPAYYDLATKGDRTDMLGRRHLDDLDLYQLIATIIMHYEDGGYFEDIGKLFLERVVSLLQRYSLYDALFECPWVFEPGVTSRTADTTTHKHWLMVEKFTAMRIISEGLAGKGITGEIRSAIREANMQAEQRFPDIIAHAPDQFVQLCTL